MDKLLGDIARQTNKSKRRWEESDSSLDCSCKKARYASNSNGSQFHGDQVAQVLRSESSTTLKDLTRSTSTSIEPTESSVSSSDTSSTDHETGPSSETTSEDSSDRSSEGSSDVSCDCSNHSHPDSDVSSSFSAYYAKHPDRYLALLKEGRRAVAPSSSSSDRSSQSSSDSDDPSDSESESESDGESESGSGGGSESGSGSGSESDQSDLSASSSSSGRSSHKTHYSSNKPKTASALTSSNLSKLQSRLESLLPKLQAENMILEDERRDGKLEHRRMEIMGDESANEEGHDSSEEVKQLYIEMNLGLGVLEEIGSGEKADGIKIKRESDFDDTDGKGKSAEIVLTPTTNKKEKRPVIKVVDV